MADIKATIFIPTYNGDKYLNEIFKMIFKQKVDFKFDVLIIDSGSKDNTLKIIEKHRSAHPDQVRLVEIDNSEFGHGKTRNYAAQIAEGEIMVYLSHDAVPAHVDWLYEMVKPFDLNEKIMGVMGRQAPRPKCVPLQKYEILGAFKNLGPEFGTSIFYKDSFMSNSVFYDPVTFYSDVNSSTRRKFLLETIPYRDVPYSEDQLFGRDIIDAGYYKAYASRGTVIHSNDLTLKEYKHRVFDEIIGLRKIGTQISPPSRKAVVRMFAEGVFKDTYRTLNDKQYSLKRKVFWLLVNPLYHIEKWRGYMLGLKVELLDSARFDKLSLESRRQKIKR